LARDSETQGLRDSEKVGKGLRDSGTQRRLARDTETQGLRDSEKVGK
jgi:hypothetical protein